MIIEGKRTIRFQFCQALPQGAHAPSGIRFWIVSASLFGVDVLPVCATAKPIVPAMQSALAEIKSFEIFMVKLR